MTKKTSVIPYGNKISFETVRHVVENPEGQTDYPIVEIPCAALPSRKHDIVDKSIWIGSYAQARRPMGVVIANSRGLPKTSKNIIRKGVTRDKSHHNGYAQVKVDMDDHIAIAAHTPESVIVVLVKVKTITMPVEDKATLLCTVQSVDTFRHNGEHTVHIPNESELDLDSRMMSKIVNKARNSSLYPTDWWDHYLTHLSVTPRSFSDLADYTTVRPSTRILEPSVFLKELETTALGFHTKLWKEYKDKEDKHIVRQFSHRTPTEITYTLTENNTIVISVRIPYCEELKTEVSSETFFDLTVEPLLVHNSSVFSEFEERVKSAKEGAKFYRTLRI